MQVDYEYLYSFSVYMVIIVLAGAFGGYVSALFDSMMVPGSPYRNHDCAKCNGRYYFCRAMVGICGAFGVVLFGGWVGKVTLALNVKSVIELISLCVISGIVSYRLLPVIGHKLQKQIDALEATTQNQSKTIDDLRVSSQDEIKREAMIQDALTMAKDLLSSDKGSSSDIYTAISLMEKFKVTTSAKYQRSFHIYLGRLYRRVKNYDAAIETLREYIDTIETDPQLPAELKSLVPKNKAAALYNIACYHSLKADVAKPSSTEPEINRLLDEALRELEISLTLDPSNGLLASDPKETDFDAIKKNPDLKKKFCAIIETTKAIATEQQ